MSASAPESHRIATRIPRQLWIGVAAAALGSLAVALQIGLPIYRQRVAMETIERVGGHFVTERHLPEWICDWCRGEEGISPFDDIVAVRMDDEQVTDVHLRAFRGLSQLTRVELDGSRITDAGLRSLKGFTKLEFLDLRDTLVTEAGLADLRGLNQLKILGVPGFKLTERGLGELCQLKSLEEVTLHGGEPTSLELITKAEAHGFDLYRTTDTEFQQRTGQSLRGRKKVALVYCYAPEQLKRENEAVDYEVAKHVAYRLNQNGIKVIDPDLVEDWLEKNTTWRKTAEIGEHFKVDYVVQIDIRDFSLIEGNSMDLYHGTANCILHVVRMDKDRTNGMVIYSWPVNSSYPRDASVRSSSVSLDKFRKEFLSVLSDEIGQKFYRPKME